MRSAPRSDHDEFVVLFLALIVMLLGTAFAMSLTVLGASDVAIGTVVVTTLVSLVIAGRA